MKAPIYFVTYVHASTSALSGGDVKNIILEGQSPLDWLASHIRKQKAPGGSQVSAVRILFWSEITAMPTKPDAVMEVITRLGVEHG